jgi:tetratricopeptide (TPR) repeat protein
MKTIIILLCSALAAGVVWRLLRRRAASVKLAREDWLAAQESAQASLDSGDFAKALPLFEKAVWLAPGEPGTAYSEVKILVGKAQALIGLDRPEEAVPALKEAVSRAELLPGAEAAELTKTARDLLRSVSAPVPRAPGCSLSVSAWADGVEMASPDGRFIASMPSALETGMGGPTLGELRISNGMVLKDCSPSIAWADDSSYLAVPHWETARTQRLLVVDLAAGKTRSAPEVYSILQLKSFCGGIILGVDSPRHQPREVRVDVRELGF